MRTFSRSTIENCESSFRAASLFLPWGLIRREVSGQSEPAFTSITVLPTARSSDTFAHALAVSASG